MMEMPPQTQNADPCLKGSAHSPAVSFSMQVQGESNHLSQHYRLIFNLVDWGTFRCIRREAIAFLDQQTSREVFRIL